MKTDMVFRKFLKKLWDWVAQRPEAESILPTGASSPAVKLLSVVREVDVIICWLIE